MSFFIHVIEVARNFSQPFYVEEILFKENVEKE